MVGWFSRWVAGGLSAWVLRWFTAWVARGLDGGAIGLLGCWVDGRSGDWLDKWLDVLVIW